MKIRNVIIFTLIMCSSVLQAQVKRVALKVDVLGPMHPTLGYYHPIQGEYKIYPKKN